MVFEHRNSLEKSNIQAVPEVGPNVYFSEQILGHGIC